MSYEFRVRGVAKPIPMLKPKPRTDHFDEVLKESDQLIAEADLKSDDIASLNPDLTFTIKSLSSIYLDSNKRFQDLKQALENFHLDSRREHPRLHPGKSAKWKNMIYTSLKKLLNECLFTNIRKLQLEYLDKVYDWYYEKIDRIQDKDPEVLVEAPKEPEPFEIDSEQVTENLMMYSRRHISSAQSLRPKTAATMYSKLFESRPPSAAKLPLQAFTGAGELRPQTSKVSFESTYVSYIPTDDDTEKKAELKFKQNREKDLMEKRLRDDMKVKVDAWTLAKARKAEEFNRKYESNKFASRFDQRGYLPSRPHTASEPKLSARTIDMIDPEPIVVVAEEDQIVNVKPESKPLHKMDKVASLRMLHEEILEADESLDEPNNALDANPNAVSLSAYSKSMKAISTTGIRPHTAGYLPPARNIISRGMPVASRPMTAQRAEQIDEVNEVKKRLAKRNIPCSIETLQTALLMPEDLPPEKLTRLMLPIPGTGLLSNPFVKEKAKKGKKKGKKSKKGKK